MRVVTAVYFETRDLIAVHTTLILYDCYNMQNVCNSGAVPSYRCYIFICEDDCGRHLLQNIK